MERSNKRERVKKNEVQCVEKFIIYKEELSEILIVSRIHQVPPAAHTENDKNKC